MAASIDEIVLESFRVDAEAFKDLDSMVKQRCCEIDPSATIEYDIRRKDSVRYQTPDVGDLINERNDRASQLCHIMLNVRTKSPQWLKFMIEFSYDLRIAGEAENRASLVCLASDVRDLVRERMKSGTSIKSRTRLIISVVALVLGCLGYFTVSTLYSNRYNSQASLAYAQSENLQTRQAEAQISSDRVMLRKYHGLDSSTSQGAELAFIVQSELQRLRNDLAANEAYESQFIQTSQEPWWGDSFYFLLASGIILAGVIHGLTYVFYPSTETPFLVGDEIRRQAIKARRRERLIWGIGVTFILGIASGIVTSAIH